MDDAWQCSFRLLGPQDQELKAVADMNGLSTFQALKTLRGTS